MDNYIILIICLITGSIIILLSYKIRQYEDKLAILKAKYEDLMAVPQEDINQIEEARVLLWRTVEKECPELITHITEVTQPMWYITHRRYDKIEIGE